MHPEDKPRRPPTEPSFQNGSQRRHLKNEQFLQIRICAFAGKAALRPRTAATALRHRSLRPSRSPGIMTEWTVFVIIAEID